MTNPSNSNRPDSKVTIIDCGSDKTPKIIQLVSNFTSLIQTVQLGQANSYPFETTDAVIISGGPDLFTDSPEKHNELMTQFRFLEQLERPTLGICLGCQAIALTFGGKVYRDKERREEDAIEILKSHPLFKGINNNSLFDEDHCEGVWPSDRMEVLAQSEFYETEAFRALNRPFLGVQFHPETSGKNGELLIGNFLSWAENQY